MISAKVIAKQVEKFAVDNAPGILTGIGAVGAVSAVILTGKATFKAADILTAEAERRRIMDPNFGVTNAEDPDANNITPKDALKLVWMEYIPAASVLAVSVTAIICANRVSTGRVAALATAYSLNDKHFNEYREKVAEKFNPNKERQVRDEIAQDRVTANPPKDAQVIITGNGEVMCYDLPTGRYFKSNMEKIRSVVNEINQQVNVHGSATLSDFYVALNLKDTPYSEEVGWDTDKLLDVHYSAVLTDDNLPCIAINYTVDPIRRSGAGFPRGCDENPPF